VYPRSVTPSAFASTRNAGNARFVHNLAMLSREDDEFVGIGSIFNGNLGTANDNVVRLCWMRWFEY
jgi:hypothetical protein